MIASILIEPCGFLWRWQLLDVVSGNLIHCDVAKSEERAFELARKWRDTH